MRGHTRVDWQLLFELNRDGQMRASVNDKPEPPAGLVMRRVTRFYGRVMGSR